MPAADVFATTIQGRFQQDIKRMADNIVTEALKIFELGDITIVQEELTILEDDIGHRVSMAADSAAWQGYQTGRVDAIAEFDDGFRWSLDPGADHCADCIQRAAGGPYTMDDLLTKIGIPGDAPTKCNGGCRCSLGPWGPR